MTRETNYLKQTCTLCICIFFVRVLFFFSLLTGVAVTSHVHICTPPLFTTPLWHSKSQKPDHLFYSYLKKELYEYT